MKTIQIKYPNITVQLIGQPKTAFPILATVRAALRQSAIPANEIASFTAEATSGDRHHLLEVVRQWVNVQYMDMSAALS